MNEIIFGITYIMIALVAVWDLLRHKDIDNKKFVKTILAVAVMIAFGLYMPIHKDDKIITKIIGDSPFRSTNHHIN
ncbi:MAG: hypothetical protein KatS3mg003_2089 [Candidatus Nitrosocaldaceae archaeon]|nr:MAG: hypothetical protein KatS3mg003_2089 [Candidatus Nitrosocaldaceae archaeon]